VGLAGVAAGSSVLAASLEAGFSLSAAAPPEVPDVAGSLVALAADSLSAEVGSPEELSLLLVVVVLVVDVDVDAALAAAASALVLVGGVISGVLFGTASETVVLPQALSVSPHSKAAHVASATRLLTTDPCACRTWDSR
jgi:hypothetical protein